MSSRKPALSEKWMGLVALEHTKTICSRPLEPNFIGQMSSSMINNMLRRKRYETDRLELSCIEQSRLKLMHSPDSAPLPVEILYPIPEGLLSMSTAYLSSKLSEPKVCSTLTYNEDYGATDRLILVRSFDRTHGYMCQKDIQFLTSRLTLSLPEDHIIIPHSPMSVFKSSILLTCRSALLRV